MLAVCSILKASILVVLGLADGAMFLFQANGHPESFGSLTFCRISQYPMWRKPCKKRLAVCESTSKTSSPNKRPKSKELNQSQAVKTGPQPTCHFCQGSTYELTPNRYVSFIHQMSKLLSSLTSFILIPVLCYFSFASILAVIRFQENLINPSSEIESFEDLSPLIFQMFLIVSFMAIVIYRSK